MFHYQRPPLVVFSLLALLLAAGSAAAAGATTGKAQAGRQAAGREEAGNAPAVKLPASPEAAAAALYAANDALLTRQLADGIRQGILVPYCRGLEAAASPGRQASCDALELAPKP
jgi:hypothetical protein